MSTPANPKIDRQTTSPFLLRLCYRTGSFHRPEEFPTLPSHATPPHLQIYTWYSCTLRELTTLLTAALPSLIPSPSIGTRIAYRLIYPDNSQPSRAGPGRYLAKDLGNVVIGSGTSSSSNGGGNTTTTAAADEEEDAAAQNGVGKEAEKLEGDAEKTLQDAKFIIGDFVSVAILPPQANGMVAAPPPPAGTSSSFSGSRGGRADFGARTAALPARENGFSGGGGYRGRGPGRGGFGMDRGSVPSGEWRRGERLPDAPAGVGYGRGRGRGRGY
ncbi:MAG: hypothetical protein M1820_002225 [Bogoriella megaspora]|nr:MAG: hypothetical protein M1820_002225 [Bogoriella megaspora]